MPFHQDRNRDKSGLLHSLSFIFWLAMPKFFGRITRKDHSWSCSWYDYLRGVSILTLQWEHMLGSHWIRINMAGKWFHLFGLFYPSYRIVKQSSIYPMFFHKKSRATVLTWQSCSKQESGTNGHKDGWHRSNGLSHPFVWSEHEKDLPSVEGNSPSTHIAIYAFGLGSSSATFHALGKRIEGGTISFHHLNDASI